MTYILTDYINAATALGSIEQLEDGTYCGRIPPCVGVIAFGATHRDCQTQLRSTLEEWILLGLKLRHPIPIVNGLDLNQSPHHEQVDAL
jgi:predicted RNase H-like HicB family nuclease